jgi:hypothetical protein
MTQQGASIPGWDLSQYPNTGSPTANIPVPIDQQIAALINGGGLTGADKIARMSDLADQISSGSVAAVRASGLLDETNFIPITAIAPFVLESGKVWIKGNIAFVALCFSLPANVIAAAAGGGINLASGLPDNAANNVANEKSAQLMVTASYKRAILMSAGAGAPYPLPFQCAAARIYPGGYLQMSSEVALNTTTLAGAEYLTVVGHYPLSLLDSVP